MKRRVITDASKASPEDQGWARLVYGETAELQVFNSCFSFSFCPLLVQCDAAQTTKRGKYDASRGKRVSVSVSASAVNCCQAGTDAAMQGNPPNVFICQLDNFSPPWFCPWERGTGRLYRERAFRSARASEAEAGRSRSECSREKYRYCSGTRAVQLGTNAHAMPPFAPPESGHILLNARLGAWTMGSFGGRADPGPPRRWLFAGQPVAPPPLPPSRPLYTSCGMRGPRRLRGPLGRRRPENGYDGEG